MVSNQILIRQKTGLQIRRMRICQKAMESDGFESGFEIRHIPNQVNTMQC